MRNNHNMWQRHMAAQIISGMFCMNSSLQDQTPTVQVFCEMGKYEQESFCPHLLSSLTVHCSYQLKLILCF